MLVKEPGYHLQLEHRILTNEIVFHKDTACQEFGRSIFLRNRVLIGFHQVMLRGLVRLDAL